MSESLTTGIRSVSPIAQHGESENDSSRPTSGKYEAGIHIKNIYFQSDYTTHQHKTHTVKHMSFKERLASGSAIIWTFSPFYLPCISTNHFYVSRTNLHWYCKTDIFGEIKCLSQSSALKEILNAVFWLGFSSNYLNVLPYNTMLNLHL